MARDRDPALDMSGLEDAFEWLGARKNILVGIALVVVLAIAATSFVQRQSRETAVQPWRALFVAGNPPWNASSKELTDLVDQSVHGSDAEPYALYWRALRQLEEGDRLAALGFLGDFQTRFASDLLCKVNLPAASPSASGHSAAEIATIEIKRLQDWSTQHPMAITNPAPDPKNSVTLATERGSIVVSLYPELAPQSCAAFLKLAASLKDQFIAKVAPDRWVDLGLTDAGAPIETKEFIENFPPYETGALLHARGAVAFRQAPFSKGPFQIDLHVLLADDFEMDGQSSVFGQVTEGLDLLSTLSKDERKSDAPQVLAHPIRITEVTIRSAAGG